MVKNPAHRALDTQTGIDPDLKPAETNDPASTTPEGPFPTTRRSPTDAGWPVLAVISAGGVTGAPARNSLAEAIPHVVDQFTWATFCINVSGCLLIGALMVLTTEAWPAPRLLRPFLGTGILGGYTTFSTYIVDIQQLLTTGATHTALTYLTVRGPRSSGQRTH